jgi:hypothetical protein
MYTIVKAQGIQNKVQTRWGDIDVSTIAVSELYIQYRVVYLTLTAVFLPEPIYVDLDVFRLKYNSFDGTVAQMLDDNGSTSFPTVDEIPIKQTKYVHYSDMFRAGYEIDVTGRNAHPSANIPDIDKIDLRITRLNPPTDMVDFYRNCLVTVNGFFHLTDTDGDYLYVHEGGKSNYKSRRNQVGMISFKDIGTIKQVPITKDMIYKQLGSSSYHDKTYIDLKDEDLTNKTVLLVLGGYLVFPQPTVFYPTGNNAYALSLGRLPLIERYYESFDSIDYTSLGIDHSSTNTSMINVAQFYSDPVIEKYLTMSQSFFVIVDTPELFMNRAYIQKTPIQGVYISGFKPTYPLVLGRGRMPEYWVREEDKQYAIDVVDGRLHRRVFQSAFPSEITNVGDSDQPVPGTYNSTAYLLEIGSDFVPL